MNVEAHKFLVLAGSQVVVRDEGGREHILMLTQDVEVQSTKDVKIQCSFVDDSHSLSE
jgi:hypothetical protein